jgi:hypothetical protein
MNTIEIVRKSNSSLVAQGLPLGVLDVSSTVTNNSLTGISSFNGLSGNVLLTGAGETTVSVNGQLITVTSTSSASAATSGLATSGFCTGISGALQSQIDNLNNNTGNYYLAANPQQYVTSGNLFNTGSLLDNKINVLSGNSVLLFGDQNVDGVKTFNTGVNISGNGVDFYNQSSPAWREGRVFYDNDEKTLAYYNDFNGITVNLGQELLVRVVNNFGAQINNGQVVYVSGAQGNRPAIYPAIATNISADRIIGVVTHDIQDNHNGYVTTNGIVHDLNLSSFLEGDTVYLSSTISGGLISSPDGPPNHIVKIGTVLNNSSTQGTLLVDVNHDDSRLSYLHDVFISSPQNNDLLSYNAISGKWLNQSSFSGLLQSGINNINNNTGNFYTKDNPYQYIRSGDVSSFYSTISNLQTTGANLDSKINSLSGYTNNFYLKSNPSGYLTGFNSGIYVTAAQTGQFYPASNPQSYATSGNLANSGVALNDKINSFSGYSNSNFATISSLINTGNNLQNQISTLNNNTGNYYLNSNPSGFVNAGDLSSYATNTYVNSGFVPKLRYNSFSAPAGCMAPLSSGGATATSVSFSNTHYFDVYSFDATSEQGVTFQFSLPDIYNNGSLKAKLFCGVASGGASGYVFGICSRAYVSGETLNQPLGPETLLTGFASNSGILFENTSNYINLTGNISGSDSLVLIKISRKVNDGGDVCNKAIYLYNTNMQWQESLIEPQLWS